MKKILHIDMDAFFAAVEIRDNLALKGKPIIIGGPKDSRGVVSTCSYEARAFGVHSAMPTKTAAKLCPDGIFLNVNMKKYREASMQTREIFKDYTSLVEPMSLDEAYLDITHLDVDPHDLACLIQKRIETEVGITASVGISFNKFLAKLGSEQNKPNGVFEIRVEDVHDFITTLPVGELFGVGKKMEAKMHQQNLKTGGDLRELSLDEMTTRFGKLGRQLYNQVRGIDNRPIVSDWRRKSISTETTFDTDVDNVHELAKVLYSMSVQVADILKKENFIAGQVVLKVKYHDFKQISRSVTLHNEIESPEEIMNLIKYLFNTHNVLNRKIRLIGVGVGNLKEKQLQKQIYLTFD